MFVEPNWVNEFREQQDTPRIMCLQLRGKDVRLHVKDWPPDWNGDTRIGSICMHTPEQVNSLCECIDELNAQPDFENGNHPLVLGCSAATCVRIEGQLVLAWSQQDWLHHPTTPDEWYLVHLTERRLAMLTRFVQLVRDASWSVTFTEPEQDNGDNHQDGWGH